MSSDDSDTNTRTTANPDSPQILSLPQYLCSVGLPPSPTPSYSSYSSSTTPTTGSSLWSKDKDKKKPLVFVNHTVPHNLIEKPRDVTYIIRAFIKYVQHAPTDPSSSFHGGTAAVPAAGNSVLFNRYMHDFLRRLHIIGWNIPRQNTAYRVRLSLSFRGPSLAPTASLRHHTGRHRYRYHAEIELSFFSTQRPADAGSVAELRQAIVSFFVQNPQLLRFVRLKLPDHWFLNSVSVKTRCTD